MYLAALYSQSEDGTFREVADAGRVHFEIATNSAHFGPAKEDWLFTHGAVIYSNSGDGRENVLLQRLFGGPINIQSGESVTLQFPESPICDPHVNVDSDRLTYKVGQWMT